MNKIFIPFNTPSLKNSKVATKRGVFMSKTCRRYLQKLGIKKYSASKHTFENYKSRKNIFHECVRSMRIDLKEKPIPHIIFFYFVRDSRHKFDFHNAVQIVADLLVAHQVIGDDDMDSFIPMPKQIDGKWYDINKSNPGCYLFY
jgi:hypothetical protein